EGLPRPLLALEFWVPCFQTCLAPLEEVFKGSSHIHERAFDRALGHLIRPGELLASDGVELFFEGNGIRLAACFMLRFPFGQRPVEHKAGGASCTRKVLSLFRRWMKPDLVRFDHP